MKLKGEWKGNQKYDVGDILRYTDGVFYHVQKPCDAGTAPVDTRYWGRLNQVAAEAASMIMDMEANDIQLENDLNQSTGGKKALDAHQGKVLKEMIPNNISENSIVLNSSTPDSTKQFLITVDDDGDITATEIEEE